MKLFIHTYYLDNNLFALFYNTEYHKFFYEYNLIKKMPGGFLQKFNYFPIFEDQLNELNVFLDEELDFINEEGIHLCNSTDRNIKLILENNNPKSYYYLIDKVNLEPLGGLRLQYPELFDKENLRIISGCYPNKNIIFDLGYLCRKQIGEGVLRSHQSLSEKFHNIPKQYRLEYSVRNIFSKVERIELFERLYGLNLDKVSLTYDTHFINLLNTLKKFKGYGSPNLSEFLKEYDNYSSFNNLDNHQLSLAEKIIKEENINNVVDKVFSVTLKSDISILYETATHELYKNQYEFSNHITEKTLDLLLIGKPFIITSKLVLDFLKLLELDTYETILNVQYDDLIIDEKLNTDFIVDIVSKISGMDNLEYTNFLCKFNEKALENRDKIQHIIQHNNLIEDILTLKHFKN